MQEMIDVMPLYNPGAVVLEKRQFFKGELLLQ